MQDMDPPLSETPRVPDMVMCGDHPSFTKKELNAKDIKDEKEKNSSYARITPTSSRTGAVPVSGAVMAASGAEARGRASEHAMRLIDARRRVRSLEQVPKSDLESPAGNRALVQAALGSFRWPPYLLAVWVVVLVLTHALHCVVTMMERALPKVKKFCQYLRTRTEEAWKDESEDNRRVYPVGLAILTGLMYCVYYALYVLYSIAVWSIEPLCTELEDKPSAMEVMETKVTNYVDEISSKTNFKH